jgi:hypothetical protein
VLVQGDNIAALDGGVIAANDARRTQTTTNGASTCASSGTPGVSLAAPRYDVFTYQNPYPFTPPVCYTATVDVASGGGVWATAYGPSFSPANALSNYLGGAGHIITAGNPGVFSFRAPTYQDFQIVVNEADEDFGSAAYTVQVHDSAQVPTAAVLRSFSAERDASGVALRWRTAAEEGFLGFNVYLLRGSSSSRLNRALIPAVFGGTRRGHAYRLHDPRGRGGARYRLEGVELDGSRGRLGDAVAG